MKKTIALALLSVIVATPVFAADSATAQSSQKNAPATPMGNMHAHKMAGAKDECASEHVMEGHRGHGMMEGFGADMIMEPNMHVLGALNLSKEQQAKVNKLSDDLKHNNWATMGLMNDETAKLRDLYEADKRDPAAIGKGYQKVFDLKRQMIEAYLDTQNHIEEILTPEQLAKLKEARQAMHHMYGHPMQ